MAAAWHRLSLKQLPLPLALVYLAGELQVGALAGDLLTELDEGAIRLKNGDGAATTLRCARRRRW